MEKPTGAGNSESGGVSGQVVLGKEVNQHL
jgi:hypothetical protein